MTRPCPACGELILVAAASRWGGHDLPFDPDPGIGPGYDTALAPDLSHVIPSAAGLLYRNHKRSCPNDLKVSMDRALPGIGGYSHKPAVRAS